MGRTTRLWITGVVTAIALLAAACGDDGESSSNAGATTGSAPPTTAAPTTKAPQSGGTLVFGEYSQPVGLDPIVPPGQGTTGGIEMVAIYDALMRWNRDEGKYEPRLAESLTNNADFTEWTIKIRPNVKFHDGTPYDAAAVVFGLNRHRSGTPGAPKCEEMWACPRNSQSTVSFMSLVKTIEAVDNLTVKVTLSEPWTGFPWALSSEAGMIPSPTALKKCDPTKNTNTCEFNVKPVGAGPFMIDAYKSKESITLVRNPNYWGGTVFLDGIKFIDLGDIGGAKSFDALKTGTLNAGFFSVIETIKQIRDAKYDTITYVNFSGRDILLNTGVSVTCAAGKPEPTCTGKPDGPTATNPVTKDVRIRQAAAAAINVQTINERAVAGAGQASNQLVQKDFKFYPDVPGPKYDPDAAKRLVNEAKASGWDGKVRVLAGNNPEGQGIGISIETMLRAVGMDPQVEYVDTATNTQRVFIDKNFDIATHGMAITADDGGPLNLLQNFESKSASNRSGYSNPAVDKAIKDLRSAKTDAERTALYKIVAENVARDVPIIPMWNAEYTIAWNSKVHGFQTTSRSNVLWHQVWMEK
jgi:peptide/nickel transport system substrate-binding protein